jgi:toxin ParE1/3/4
MVKIIYTTPASIDLNSIFVYISNDSVVNAKRFVRLLKNHIKSLKEFPEKGRQISPETFPTLRQVLYKSYKIIYTYDANKITIHVITHQSRLNINIDALKQFYI